MNILETFTVKLRNKRYAERTIEIYCGYVSVFIEFSNIKDPYQSTIKQIMEYLENYNYSSRSQQNQIISALKAFAIYFLNRKDLSLKNIERPRKEVSFQPVIPRQTMIQSLCNIKNLKHLTIITIAYQCALRVSEIINLRWENINREELIIHIKSAKGNKDRNVPINETIIDLLIEYYIRYKTKGYVFSGQDWRPQYSASSCNSIVKNHIGKKYKFHSLRKSSAVHRYEAGDDLAKIQDLLGHSKIETTRIYVKESNASIKQLIELV